MRTGIERLLAWLQDLLPQRLLTALVHRLMRSETGWIKNSLITVISSLVGVDWSEAASTDLADYRSFNAFFTRELKPGARALAAEDNAVISPCDGRISELGDLDGDTLLQAKHHVYSLETLLAEDPACAALRNGLFCTLYLSPRDYHRVHMPLEGELQRMVYVPGKLYSVAPYTVRQVPGLFARNERVACLFETPVGPMAVVLVGAMLVGSMETVWAGMITPAKQRTLTRTAYQPGAVRLARGAEMGRFNMGSTVIVVLPPGVARWQEQLAPGMAVRMGQALGFTSRSSAPGSAHPATP